MILLYNLRLLCGLCLFGLFGLHASLLPATATAHRTSPRLRWAGTSMASANTQNGDWTIACLSHCFLKCSRPSRRRDGGDGARAGTTKLARTTRQRPNSEADAQSTLGWSQGARLLPLTLVESSNHRSSLSRASSSNESLATSLIACLCCFALFCA